jgi:casein kinase II subunit alpha
MHRDIKPGNILVHPGPHARLIDWNLASLYFFSKQNEVELGTLCYMSPEMLIGYPYYHYSIDIWGLGSAMLEWYYGIRLKGDTQ